MESYYQAIAILTAGVALTLGIISLLAFLGRGREKVQLIFAIMCLLVVTFVLLPPVGFFLSDAVPYQRQKNN